MTSCQLHLLTFLPTGLESPAGDGAFRFCDLERLRAFAALAEEGCFDAIFIADSNAPPSSARPPAAEAVTVLSALAALTTKIGLVASLSTTYNEPYTVARMMASLDHLSNGRAGWNVVTSPMEQTAGFYGRDFLKHADRYDRAREFLEAVVALWDSWSDDAILAHRSPGSFYDARKVREICYEGEIVRVSGALNIPRPPQGRPVLFQAGMSDAGRSLAGQYADAVYMLGSETSELKPVCDDVRSVAASYERDPRQVKLFCGLSPIITDTEAEARELAEMRRGKAAAPDFRSEVERLSALLRVDLSDLRPDDRIPPELLPDVRTFTTSQGVPRMVMDFIRRNRPTLRQYVERQQSGAFIGGFVGTPLQLADHMETLFRNGATDGFILNGALDPEALRYFVARVVPELQDRGLFRTRYEGSTLRSHLGLPRPENIFPAREVA